MLKNKLTIYVVISILMVGAISFFLITNKQSISAPIFYVANAGDGTIAEINLENENPVRSIELDVEQIAHGIAISPDESVIYYGTGYEGNRLLAMDVNTKKVLKETTFEERVHGIDIHPTGKYVYVSLTAGLGEEGGALAVVDTETFEVLAMITTDDGPAHVSVSADGSQIWVANVNGDTVSAVDAYTFQVLATIPVGKVPNEVALSPNLDFAFVANVKSNSLTVIDMLTFEIVTELEVGEGVHGVTVSPDGKQVWTANNDSSDVSVIDIETLSLVTTIETGSYANHISFSPAGDLAFLTQREANNLVMIDTKDYQILKEYELGKDPHEMTLKGMELKTINDNGTNEVESYRNLWEDKYVVDRDGFAEEVEVKVRLLSPYDKEDTSLLLSNHDIDPLQYYALNVEMTTHSGDLTSIPFADRIFLINNVGDEIIAEKWIDVSKDSHHPQFLALFEKTVDKLPILKSIDTKLSVQFRPFIKNENLVIDLSE